MDKGKFWDDGYINSLYYNGDFMTIFVSNSSSFNDTLNMSSLLYTSNIPQ